MVSIRVGLHAAPTSGTLPVAQDLTASGMTETPKASILALSNSTSDGTAATHHHGGMGAAVTGTSRAMDAVSESGQTPAFSDAEGRYDTDTCLQHTLDANNNLDGEAEHVSFAAGKQSIQWPDLLAAAHLFQRVFFGGSDVSAALVDFTGNGTSGNTASITGLSFAPNMAIIFGRGNAAFAADGTWSPFSFIQGVVVKNSNGDPEQMCASMAQADRSGSFRGIFRTDRCAQRLTPGADQGGLWIASSAHFTGDGLTFTTGDANDAISVVVLCLRLPNYKLKVVTNPSLLTTGGASTDLTSTGVKRVTGLGFKPKACMILATAMTSSDASSTAAGCMNWSRGWVDEAGNVATVGGQTEVGANPGDTRSIADSSKVVRVLNDSGGDDWAASFDSFVDDEVRINVTSAASGARAWGLLVIGPDPVSASGSLVLDNAVLSGSAAEKFSASGSLSVQRAALSGSATLKFSASGAISSAHAVLAGSSAEKFSASGALARPPTVLLGSAEEEFTASGSLTTLPAVLAGAAAERFSASGALTLVPAVLAGAAAETFAASGALLTAAAILAGTANIPDGAITASGGISVGAALLSGTALERFSADGALLVQEALLAGTATERFSASGDITIDAALLSGQVALIFASSGGITVPVAALSGAALERFVATGQFTVPHAILRGTDQESIFDLLVLQAGRRLLIELLAGRKERLDLDGGSKTIYDLDASF